MAATPSEDTGGRPVGRSVGAPEGHEEHVPHGAASDGPGCRRSLILAGGGMRVAYQAGVIRALLEAGLTFSHADGTSGGIINLGMLLSGLSPEEMCERWRTLDVRRFVSFMPARDYLRAHDMMGMGDARGITDHVFPHLGISVPAIRSARGIAGTFNVCDFSRKTNEAIAHEQIDLARMVAGVSLPILMPPVKANGIWYTDSVWIRDANLLEAVRRGAEELWVVWAIGNTPDYRSGAFNQYVHMIELSANGALFEDLERIAEINRRIEQGEVVMGHTKPIRIHVVRPEVPLPLDPDYFFGRIDAATLIDLGYADAAAYLAARNPDGLPLGPEVTQTKEPLPGVAFREQMAGPFSLGESDPLAGLQRGTVEATDLVLSCAIHIQDVARFIREPNHTGSLVGHIRFPPFGQTISGRRGRFNVFVAGDNPRQKQMVYELGLRANGQEYFLAGRKFVEDDPGFDLWSDTTTLYTRLHQGTDSSGPVVGAGVLRIHLKDMARLASTLHATHTGSATEAARLLSRFARFFAGELRDTYLSGKAIGALAPAGVPSRSAPTAPGADGAPLGQRAFDAAGSALRLGLAAARSWCEQVEGVVDHAGISRRKETSSLRFTEEMKGFVCFGERSYRLGYQRGQGGYPDAASLKVHATIVVPNVQRFVNDPWHEARAEGYIECDGLGGRRPIERGTFNLFVDTGDGLTKRMLYRLYFSDDAGRPRTLTGFKVIQDDPGADIWSDTTTTYTRILHGHVPAVDQPRVERADRIIASGIIRIWPAGFLRQLTTFRSDGRTFTGRAGALTRFCLMWALEALEARGARSGPLRPPGGAADDLGLTWAIGSQE